MEDKIHKKKEDRSYEPAGLIIALLIIIGLGVGGFFLYRYVIGPYIDNYLNPTVSEPTETDNSEVQYNKLLKVLNDQLLDSETKANELVSVTYQSQHFMISGYTSDQIYYCDISLGDYADTKAALDVIVNAEDFSLYTIEVTRYTRLASDELDNKYFTSDASGKRAIGNLGSVDKAFMTCKTGEEIKVINNVDLSEATNDSYSPLLIGKTNSLYKFYSYIASK